MAPKDSFLLYLLICLCSCTTAQKDQTGSISWDQLIRNTGTFSSPRATDLNRDGIKDIVFGAGKVEFQPSDSGVIALNGADGSILWMVGARDQIFGSPGFMDITNDGIPEVFIGGRSAELMAIDGENGNILWEYFPQGDSVDFTEFRVYNFYNPQFVRDADDDGVLDLLIANGGYVKAGPYDLNRPPGKLMIISSVKGKLIAEGYMPDEKETYMSSLVMDPGSSNPGIIFGSGGERISGHLYITTLKEVLDGDLSGARILATGKHKGFVAPPVIADITQDGVNDIIVGAVEGRIMALDGVSYQIIWRLEFPGTEIYSSLGVGFFDSDEIPDFFVNLGIGTFPNLMQSMQLSISGATGEILRQDSLGAFHYGSPSVYDLDEDGFDEVIYHLNDVTASLVKNELKVFDINNDSIYSLSGPWNGANLGSTPLLIDLDSDHLLDVITIHENNPVDFFSVEFKTGIEIHRIKLKVPVHRPIRWGSYMGSSYNGIF